MNDNNRWSLNYQLMVIWFLSLSTFINSASFYGQSYVKIPFYQQQQLHSNRNETRIELQFRTHQLNAFIFLAAGSSDYCLLYLDDGRLAVKINFGLGETFLRSKNDATGALNDLQWHHIYLERIDQELLLKIDSNHTYSTKIHGLYSDNNNGLKIQYGIYLGNQHGLKSLYLADLPSFRGCIDAVEFNGKKLFDLIGEQHTTIVHDVDFEQRCDRQFDAINENDYCITFTKNENSFILMPNLLNQSNEFAVDFDLKTTSSNAMIVFMAGMNAYKKEYFTIEIISKRLKISLTNGNEQLILQSIIIIADSHWHHVQISFVNNNQLILVVDEQRELTSPLVIKTWQSLFANELFLGGLSVEKQSLAINNGIESVLITSNVSLKGCLKNFEINSKQINVIKEAFITNRIFVSDHCKWQFLCDTNDSNEKPCINDAKCIHETFDRIQCLCHHSQWINSNEIFANENNRLLCVQKNFKHKSIIVESIDAIAYNDDSEVQQHEDSLISCDDKMGEISVIESSTTEINNELWKVLIDAQILSDKIDDDNVFDVVVVKKPDYGSINLDQMKIDINSLHKQSIQYTHIISGKTRDSMSIQLVNRQSFDQMKCDRYLMRIAFKIISPQQQNDVASIDTAKVKQSIHQIQLNILANQNFPLTPSIFKLKETIKGKNKKKDDHWFDIILIDPNDQGYFALNNDINVEISNFTETDVHNGNVIFVHRRNSLSKISPIKSMIDHNGKQRFELTFTPFDLLDNEIINTGITMAHRTYAFITVANLTLKINETIYQEDKNIGQILRYEIDPGPRFGRIQKLRSLPNHWLNVTQFTQRQLERGKIRYIHLNGLPESDRFGVKILFDKQLIDRIEFHVNFVKLLELESLGTNSFNFSKNEKEFIITNIELAYQTQPVNSDLESIRYRLRSVPLFGTLYLSTSDLRQTKLHSDSEFNQKDLNERRIFYVRNDSFVNVDSFNDLIDSFSYDVFILNTNISKTATFDIYFDNSSENYVLINRKLTVLEGDRSVIDSNHLFLRSIDSSSSSSLSNGKDFIFTITKQPKFGHIEVDENGQIMMNVSQISQRLLLDKKVYYVHDDSENNIDFFDFSVENFMNNKRIEAKFSIEIMMKNDNPPQRKCYRRLNIIRNTERILTGHDICYVDLDLNTWPNNILFTKIYSTIGSFHWLNGSMAQSFTQQDLNDGLIKFRHNGQIDTGKAIFSITDGHYNLLSESLEIMASDAYIDIIYNNGSIVKYGETCLITANNLLIETNLPDKSEIFIKLLNEPHYGQILINDKSTNHFTLQQLEDGLVEYESTIFEDETMPLLSRNDSFEFRVYSNDHEYKDLVTKSQEFIIRIFPQNYFHLDIIKMENITMLEDSQVMIDMKTLMVQHLELNAEQIVHTIVVPPKSGVIKKLIKSPEGLIIREEIANSFTQQDIINGLILYQNIQSKYSGNYPIDDNDDFIKNDDRFHDSFTIEIGDNIFRFIDHVFHIELIPKFITLQTNNLTVSEGNSATLTRSTINLTHSYYMKYVDEFVVIEEPKYGTISSISVDNVRLSIKLFTAQQLDSGRIFYHHDSSEYEHDWFTIVARANSIEKESLPATIHISIISINDEAPRLDTNVAIDGQINQKFAITNASLYAFDPDSKPNEIIYQISMPINGYLINTDTNMTVEKFTQADIDDGHIYFIHVGTSNGSFRFQLTDGKNYGPSNIFRINIRTRHIMIDANQKMFITPGSQQSITNRHLKVSSSDPDDDNEQREFIYRIIKTPSYGRIILDDGLQSEEITNFTQKQINENLVLYDQNTVINEPIVLDRIIFNIESPNMPSLKSVHFIIEIAKENMQDLMKSNINSMVPIETLTVVEGKFRPISFKELDFQDFIDRLQYEENKILLKIIRQPLYGIILRNGLILDNYALFPVTAIRNQSIVYMHDDSNTFADHVVFAIYTNDNFLIPFMNLTLPIRIIPVNDEYPLVVNQNPKMVVNIGSKTLITRSILYTRDYDGNDTNIIYMISANRNSYDQNGFFIRKNYSQEMSIHTFTQQDINDNQIEFVHRGKQPIRLVYWFRVKDELGIECSSIEPPSEINFLYFQTTQTVNEEHCTPYYPLTISVVQFVVELLNKSDVHLYQNLRKAPITQSNLAIKTDDSDIDLDEIIYQIKKGPFYGHLLVDGKQSLSFTQQQINDCKVFYVQDNTYNDVEEDDMFTFDIFQRNNEKVSNNIDIKVIIVPLVKAKKPFVTAFLSQKSLISSDHVDASELASETKSNPIFKIVKQPKYGSLSLLNYFDQIMMTNYKNDNQNLLNEFSQDDIIKNRLVYETFANIATIQPHNEILTDHVWYKLHASNVQAAKGVLVIKIFKNQSQNNDELMNQILMKTSDYFGMAMYTIREQFFLLIFLLLFILLLIAALLVICRMCCCYKSKKTEKILNKCSNEHNCNAVTQTLSSSIANVPLSTDHSSSITHSSSSSSNCLRPNIDHHSSASHYSSSSTFHDHSILRTENLSVPDEHSNTMMTALTIEPKPFINYDFDDHLQYTKCVVNRKFGHDDMSPLPPPSLYFIDDCKNTNQKLPFNNSKIINSYEMSGDHSCQSLHSGCDDNELHSSSNLVHSYSPPSPFGSDEDSSNRYINNNANNNQHPQWI